MKKVFSVLFIIFALCITTIAYAAPKSKKAAFSEIEIETKSGNIINGTLYSTKQPKRPLVVMLHSFGMKSSNWRSLPREIQAKGFNVLALDLRGHGKSVYDINLKYHSRSYFSDKEWKELPQDVLESIDYLKQNYAKIDCDKIYFIGADLGANTAVLAGSRLKIKPQKLILISPLVNFKGLYTPIVISSYANTPMLIMVSKQDKNPYEQANLLSKFIQSPLTRKDYPHGGTGMLLILRNKGANQDVINYLLGIPFVKTPPTKAAPPEKK